MFFDTPVILVRPRSVSAPGDEHEFSGAQAPILLSTFIRAKPKDVPGPARIPCGSQSCPVVGVVFKTIERPHGSLVGSTPTGSRQPWSWIFGPV